VVAGEFTRPTDRIAGAAALAEVGPRTAARAATGWDGAMNPGKRIRRLLDRGDRSRAGGDLAAAIDSYQQARGLAEADAGQDPHDIDGHELLARIQTTLGELHYQHHDHQAAIEVLKVAEASWERVAGLRGARDGQGLVQAVTDLGIGGLPGSDGGPEIERAIADVAIIRARAHAELGHPFSGLADAQQALFAYVVQAQAADPPADFDQALVAAGAAYVQLRVGGDPEIIAAAAGYAVFRYGQGFVAVEPWRRAGAQIEHWRDVTTAVDVAYSAYRALGQHDRAEAVRRLVEPDGAPGPDRPGEDVIGPLRQRPTLPAVLAQVAPELHARLPELAAANQLVVPLLRVRLASAAEVAAELARLAEAALDRGDLPAGMRLALDAHLLFAGASQLGTSQLRYQYHQYGAAWSRVLHRAGRQWLDDGAAAVAVDASDWLTGVCGGLIPHAIYDEEIRSLVTICLRWQHELYTGLGDAQAVENVAQAMAMVGAAHPQPSPRPGPPERPTAEP
jgi:hypothetical protein